MKTKTAQAQPELNGPEDAPQSVNSGVTETENRVRQIRALNRLSEVVKASQAALILMGKEIIARTDELDRGEGSICDQVVTLGSVLSDELGKSFARCDQAACDAMGLPKS